LAKGKPTKGQEKPVNNPPALAKNKSVIDSVGKIVLFRDDGNLTKSSINLVDPANPFWVVEAKLGVGIEGQQKNYDNWFESQQTSIFRTQTFNYSVTKNKVHSNLEVAPSSEAIIAVSQVEGVKDGVYFTDSLAADSNTGINEPTNLQPYNSVNNEKGMLPSDYSFVSHNLSVSRPLITTETKMGGDGNETVVAGFGFDNQLTVTPVYNFYLADYENFKLKGAFTDSTHNIEKAIPNFYYALFDLQRIQKQTEAGKNNPNWKSTWTINSMSAFLKRFGTGIMNQFTNPTPGIQPWKRYIDELTPQTERNSFIVLTSDFYKTHNSLIEKQKDTYPLYNKISIPTQKQGTAFREFFKQIKYYDDLQFAIATALKATTFMNANPDAKDNIDKITNNYNLYTLSARPGASGEKLNPFWHDHDDLEIIEFRTGPAGKSLLGTTDLQLSVDLPQVAWTAATGLLPSGVVITGFMQYVSSKQPIDLETFIEVAKLLGADPGKTGFNPAAGWWNVLNLKDYLLPLVFYGNEKNNNQVTSGMSKAKAETILPKLINMIKLKAASVFQNKQNYSEILYYEIAKFKGAYSKFSKKPPIQTFLLPNDTDQEAVEYIDSQIKYGEGYYYQIYAHTISIGNNLKRGDADSHAGNAWLYENNYDVKILRVPYYNIPEIEGTKKSEVTVNLDSPPMPPNIEFFPYKNVSDKIGFWFNIQMGEAFMYPVTSLLSNKQYSSLVAASYEKRGTDLEGFTEDDFVSGLENTEIFYKTDDYGGKFEVFRLTERPKTYADFKNAKISTIDVLGDKTLISDIQPNQDYYYIFRTIDVHGMPSNPTPVYHFKMITHNDIPETDSVHVGVSGGQPVLFNELIYLDDNYEKKIDNKSFKKYLLIEPSLKQSFLSFDNFGAEKEISTKNEVLNKMSDLTFGNSEEKLFDKKFKIRITSKQTGRKLDVNVHFKSPSIDESYEES